MAKGFCILPEVAEALKNAVAKGEWSLETLYEMSSKQRQNLFKKYTDIDTALSINVAYEKAMISKQQDALTKWVGSVFVASKTSEKAQVDVFHKIQELQKNGYIKIKKNDKGELEVDEAGDILLDGIIEDSLGITLTNEEMSTLMNLNKELEALAEDRNDLGLPTEEYFAKRREMENYMLSRVPSHPLAIATGTIGRGSMLFSLKSPILNIESNTIQGVLQKVEKRITRGITGRKVKIPSQLKELGKEYNKYATNMMWKYGFDVTRIVSLTSDVKTLGEIRQVHSQGEGKTRAVGRFYEDIVFNKMLSVPDVAFAAWQASDSVALWAMETAKKEAQENPDIDIEDRAEEIMRDALTITPQTAEGREIRDIAIADAQRATWTNDGALAKFALKSRDLLNIGSFRLGDLIAPFVKTPANVIQAGVEYAGGGIAVGTQKYLQTIKDNQDLARSNPIKTFKAIMEAEPIIAEAIARSFVRAGLGMTFAFLFAMSFDPEDFWGPYPKGLTEGKEKDWYRLQNATASSVRLGDKWVSLDYLGPIGSPVLGLLYSKKYGQENLLDGLLNYMRGGGSQLLSTPAVEDVVGTYDSFQDFMNPRGDSPEEVAMAGVQGLIDFVRARTIPGILNDIAKTVDPYERDTYDPTNPFTKVMSTIPGLRQQLPIKETIFGQKVETEDTQLIFGARVKTVNENKIIEEYQKLREVGLSPVVSNIEWTSKDFKLAKERLSESDYNAMVDQFQEQWIADATAYIDSEEYIVAGNETKKDEFNKIRRTAYKKALKDYGKK